MSSIESNVSLPCNPSPVAAGSQEPAVRFMDQAYQRVAAELAAIPDDQLARLNVDPAAAATLILDKLPGLHGQRAAWVERLASLDLTSLDRLEDYALALLYTHSLVAVVEETASDLPEGYESALAQRDALLAAAKALSAFGLLDASRFERIGLERGYRNVGLDLQSLAAMYREEWPRIGASCPFDASELDLAVTRANLMVRGSVERTRSPGSAAASLKERQRAFTALSRAYDDVRRAVAYLRWKEDDASSLAPGLVPGGRGNARRATARDDERASEPPKPLAPVGGAAVREPEPEPDDSFGKDSLFAVPAGR